MYEVVYVFVGFWDGDYVSQLPYVWYYVVGESSLNMLVRMQVQEGLCVLGA